MSTPAPILLYTLNNKDLLPAGYTPLVYIESTGTQYIDTGVLPDPSTTDYLLDFLSVPGDYVYLGASISSWETAFCISSGGNSGGNTTYYILHNGAKSVCSLNGTARHFFCYFGTTANYDGNNKSISRTSLTINKNIYLFANNSNGSVGLKPSSMKCYSCRIWTGGSLVVDLRPCIQDSNGAIGMYDLVSRTFKTNSGSGTFIAGPELAVGKGGGKSLPEEYLLVEYLESNGELYINTGLVVTSDNGNSYDFEALVIPTSFPTGNYYYVVAGVNTHTLLAWREGGKASIGNATSSGTFFTIGKMAKITAKFASSAQTYYVDGTSTGLSRAINTTTNIYLFGISTSGYNMVGRLQYAKFGTSAFFIPCYRKSDMKPGMYDVVRSTFYTNAGTGEFILGPTVCPYYSWEPNAAGLNMYPFDTTRTFTTTNSASSNRISGLGFNGNPGPWTISFDAYASTNITVLGDICDRGGKTFNLTTTKLHFFLNATAVDYYGPGSAHPTSYNGFWDMETNSAATIYISNIMMTHANGDVSYTPPNSKGLYTNVSSTYDSSKGWVADFNGSSLLMVYVSTNSILSNNQFSMSAWVKRTGGTTIFAFGGDYPSMVLEDSRFFIYGPSNELCLGSYAAKDTNWYHYVMTYNKNALKLYIDTLEIGSSSGAFNLKNNSYIDIGGRRGSGQFIGQLTNFILWDLALTLDLIKELYGK